MMDKFGEAIKINLRLAKRGSVKAFSDSKEAIIKLNEVSQVDIECHRE